MSVDKTDFAQPRTLTGSFTSAATPGAVSESLPWKPSFVICFVNVEGTNPDIYVGLSASSTKCIKINGVDGVVSSPAPSSGIALTSTGFTVAAGAQVGSGKNAWIAFK